MEKTMPIGEDNPETRKYVRDFARTLFPSLKNATIHKIADTGTQNSFFQGMVYALYRAVIMFMVNEG